MIAADRETVAVSTKDEDMKIVTPEAYTAGKRDGPAMKEMPSVGIDEIREPRRATDAGHGDDALVRQLQLFQRPVERGKDREVPATRAPGGVIGLEVLAVDRIARAFQFLGDRVRLRMPCRWVG